MDEIEQAVDNGPTNAMPQCPICGVRCLSDEILARHIEESDKRAEAGAFDGHRPWLVKP